MHILLELAPWIITFLLLFFVAAFCWFYWWPAHKVRNTLLRVTEAVMKPSVIAVGPRRPEEFQSAMRGTSLGALWEEYAETIHTQNSDDGRQQYRATIQAGHIFTAQNVVDTPMNVEFFKHLPGILTGLGILGTFAGLIKGLEPFQVGGALSDPEKTQVLVGALLIEVKNAFFVSGGAILLAMFVTAVEKFQYAKNLSHLEKLCEAIDKAFQLGVGEEYLSKLVRAAEGTYDKTRQLKDSLVNDLKGLLESVTAAQVQAIQQSNLSMRESMESNNRSLGSVISESIAGSLKEPLDQLARTSQAVAGDQSQGVQTLLTTVLQDFMNRIEGSFGKQFTGMDQMMSQLVRTLEDTRRSMDETVVQMRAAGTQSLAEVNHSLQDVLRVISTSQDEMNQKSQEAILGLVGKLKDGQDAVLASLDQKAQSTEEAGNRAMSTIGSQVSQISGGLEETMARLESTIGGLVEHIRTAAATNDNVVRGLNEGAANIKRAAEGISGAWSESEKSISGTRDAVAAIRQSTDQLRTAIEGLRAISEAQSGAMTLVQSVLADARDTSVLSNQARAQLTGTIETLSQATNEYVTRVPKSIEDNFRVFGESMVKNISNTQGALDQVWGGVLGDLRTLLQDMESFMASQSRDVGGNRL